MKHRYRRKYPYAKQNYEWRGKKKARSERRWTIGSVWKCGNACSLPVLITQMA